MTEHDRNVRTLLVSFVIAMMVMVPLRFIEATQSTLEEANRVLGETTVYQPVIKAEKPVVKSGTELEAPYEKIEASASAQSVENNCLTAEVAATEISALTKAASKIDSMSPEQTNALFEEISNIKAKVCNQ